MRSWCATGTLLKRSKYAREMRFGSVRCSTVRPLLRLYACVAGARLLSYARDNFFTPSDRTVPPVSSFNLYLPEDSQDEFKDCSERFEFT